MIMEMVYVVQILTALLIICVYIIVMLTVMVCGSYYCTKPIWEKLHDSNIELDSQEPSPAQDEATLI